MDTNQAPGGATAAAPSAELPFKWVEDVDARWHRIADVTDGAAIALCGLTLADTDATRWEPPPEPAARCRLCEIEGEGAPPNH